MSHRRPPSITATRREVFRAIAAALPAAALGCKGSDDGGTSDGTTTEATGDTAPVDTGLSTEAREEAPSEAWEGSAPVDPLRFPLGAQTGDPEPDRFVGWTYAPDDSTVELHIARWDGSAWVSHDVLTGSPSAEGYLHVDVTGLEPLTYYAVQAVAAGVGSAVTHAVTAPDPEAAVEVRFGGISCLDQTHGEFPCLDALQTLGPIDAMLWLGDTIYADGLFTEAAYRSLWQQQLSKDTFQRMLAFAPGIFTWDDHEVTNNWDPQTISSTHLDTAVKTFFETTPMPSSVRTERKLWRSLRYGRTVELFMTDVRSERDRAAGEYVSPEQLDWLKQGLSDSPCVWKVVVTSVPITDWPLAYDVLDAHLDRWDGFETTQRQELLDHIVGADMRGVFFVSGDLHQSTLSYVDPPEGTAERLLEFLVGPGGSFLNIAARLLNDDQFPYGDADWSAGRMVFRPDGTARLQTIHENGDLMMEAVIDIDGNVTLELEHHPWREED